MISQSHQSNDNAIIMTQDYSEPKDWMTCSFPYDLFPAIKPLIAVNKRVWSKLSWNSRHQWMENGEWGGICCISRDFILRKTTCSPSRCSLGRFATALASVCKTTVLLPFCLRYPEKKKNKNNNWRKKNKNKNIDNCKNKKQQLCFSCVCIIPRNN